MASSNQSKPSGHRVLASYALTGLLVVAVLAVAHGLTLASHTSSKARAAYNRASLLFAPHTGRHTPGWVELGETQMFPAVTS